MLTDTYVKFFVLSLLTVFPLLLNATENPYPQFQDYPAKSVYTGKPAKVVLSTADEKAFRTRLRAAATQPANFAGEYVLTIWGCGADCVYGAAVSLKTGHVVFLPGTVCCWEGADEKLVFRIDSQLFVAQGVMDEESEYGIHYYEFTGHEFRYLSTLSMEKTYP